MKYTKQIISEAIKICIGDVEIGDIVGHESKTIAFSLIDIIDDMGYCEYNGEQHIWLISELFNVNKLKKICISIHLDDMLIPNRLN